MKRASPRLHPAHTTSTRTATLGRLLLAVALASAGSLASLAPTGAAAAARASAASASPQSGARAIGPSIRADRLSGSGLSRDARSRIVRPAIVGPLSISSGCASSWNLVSSPNGGGDNFLDGTASTKQSDVWAVGNQTSGGFDRTLAEHWNGGSWSVVPTSNVGSNHNDLNAVAAFAANNAWAVGAYTDHFVLGGTTYDIPQNLIMHWDGSSWTILPSVNATATGFVEVTNSLIAISGSGPSDIWAVGEYYDPNVPAFRTLGLHYDGTSWTINNPLDNTAGDNGLFGLTARTSSDAWATGYFRASGTGDPSAGGNGTPRQALTEHWNGTGWTIAASPSVNVAGDSVLNGVSAVAASDVWAAGYGRVDNTSTGLRQTLIEHYDGTSWTIIPSANPGAGDNVLYGIDMLGASAGWVAGYQRSANTNPQQTLTEHYDGTSWTAVASANNGSATNVLFALTALGASDVWAGGWYTNGTNFQTLTENFCIPPTVTGIAPTAGPTTGGTTVTITGTNFLNATGVNFGSSAAASFVVNSDTQITAVSPPEVAGQVDVTVTVTFGNSATSSADRFTFVPLYVFSPQPIAPSGTLTTAQSVSVTVTAKSFNGAPAANATVYLSFVPATGGGTATAGTVPTPLTATPTAFTADANGVVPITYTAPVVVPTTGTDTITAQDTAASPTVTAQDTYSFDHSTTFFFAEGFTGTGFTESLSMLMPKVGGTATIDYYTELGHQPTKVVTLTAGQVAIEDVNGTLGAGHQVSARVVLSGPGIVERTIHFNNGTWHGSTDKVGVNNTATEWDFAEGSTLSIFNEFLSLQNPNPYPVVVDLKYSTDISVQPTKTLTVAANTRVTVVVFAGDLTDTVNCAPLTTCGVGSGIVGVSVQVKSRTLPIVAERPFYVMNYSFGYGPIRDGHDAFGANAPSTTWNFAEGTTLNGFNEYLTLQNPGQTLAAHVTIKYLYDLGTKTVTVTVGPRSRTTALVFDAANLGVGRGYVGVSTQITSDQPIVAERPMYIYFNFGTGPVAGAHVVVGATGLGTLFGFAAASTASGDNDYLTIQNSGSVDANVTVDYYTPTGKVTKVFVVTKSSRHTVLVFGTSEGAGAGIAPLGIVVSSDQPVLVEKPTYSSNSATYGATDTTGYTPPGGF